MKTHLLVFPELSLNGHRDLVVLQFFTVQQLLQEVAFSGLLPDEVGRHGWRVRYTGLTEGSQNILDIRLCVTKRLKTIH